MEYYILLEKLLHALVDTNTLDLKKINSALGGMCKIFRISKEVTVFYESLEQERRGIGEEVVCYDDGKSCGTAYTERIVTEAQTVATCSVYMTEGAEGWTEDEREKVQLLQRMILSVTSRSRLQRIVEKLSFYDNDGYPNLRYFFRHIRKLEWEGELAGMAAVHFNLAHFSLVNQQVGRNAGNLVMRSFFSTLGNLVGEEGTVSRVGGDNFVLLCARDKLDAALGILKGTPVVYDVNSGERIMVSAAAGVFVIPDNFEFTDNGDIMDKIISASQQARTGGGDSVVFYDTEMVMGREKMIRVQSLFAEALEREEFQVYYQPKVSVYTGELIGAEALCRWVRDGKIVPPMDFIPILEQNTDICKLDFYMLDHVCRDIRQWLDEGRTVVRTSVNLSRKHMMDFELKEHILEIIDRHQVPHEFIEIELTETTTDVEFRDLKRVTSGLQEEGIFTSVDDFGIGYSSLNLLKEVPWNVLKVDKSFLPIEGDDENSTRSIMFRYVVAMARELGLECIAEGVETKEQVGVLRENHCDIAQGYFFDKPLPREEYEKRLALRRYEMN